MASDTTAQTPTSDADAPPEPPAQSTPPAASATLTASANGDLATVTGTGLPAGRLDVTFTAPSGTVSTTAAIVDEDGRVTTYGRLYESGKYKIAVKDSSGHALASTAYTNPAS